MMRCSSCGLEQKEAFFCRGCGTDQRQQPSEQDQPEAATKPMTDRFSFNTGQAKPVVPIVEHPMTPREYPPCRVDVRGVGNYQRGAHNKLEYMIELRYSATWIIEEIDTDKINSIKDEAFKKKVVRWARTPKNYDFSSDPLEKIAFVLEKDCTRFFGKKAAVRVEAPPKKKEEKDTRWRMILANWLTSSESKADDKGSDVISREKRNFLGPLSNVEVNFVCEYGPYGFSTQSSDVSFQVWVYPEPITDIYNETERIMQKLTDLMNSYYDWSSFDPSVSIYFSFPFNRNFIELLKRLLDRDDADSAINMRFAFDCPLNSETHSIL